MKKIRVFCIYQDKNGMDYLHVLRKFDQYTMHKKQPAQQFIDYENLMQIDKDNPNMRYGYTVLECGYNRYGVSYIRLPTTCLGRYKVPLFLSETKTWH